MAGNLSITRKADSSISAAASGTVKFSIQAGSTSTTHPVPTTINGGAHNVKIALKTGGNGYFKLGVTGKLRLYGYLNTNAISGILGSNSLV